MYPSLNLHNQMLFGSFYQHPNDPRFNDKTNKSFQTILSDLWAGIADEINNREVYEHNNQ